MPDFRSKSEQAQDQHRKNVEIHNYRQAFENAQSEIDQLKTQISELVSQASDFRTQLQTLAQTQAEGIRELRSQVEAGLEKLNDDNKKLHTLIQSGQAEDLKLVEQMDANHRERMENIMRLVDQKGLPNG